MADLDPVSFLRATPPFDGLPPHEFERASAALEVVFHPAGDLIIARDGPPSEHLYIVRKGLVRLERDGETVLVLEPGELFGFTSVMAGATPFNVVVERDLLAYRVAAGVVRSMLIVPAVARYFSESLAERLRWTTEPARVASGGDLHLPVERLVRRAPVVVAPDATVGDVARRMSDAQASSALVDVEPMGIVTDRDLRDRVLAQGRGLDTPVIDVATRPVRTIAAGTPVYEAWHLLVQHGVHHLPVARGREILGVLSDADLLRHQTSGPTALFARIEHLGKPDEARGYAADVARMVGTLVEAGLDVTRIARLVSRLNDALVARFLRVAEADLGPRPCDYAWVVFGAEGRYEQLLITDQDNAIVYGDDTPEAGEYFGRLAERGVGDLETAGFPRCPGGFMATTWRAPIETWIGRFGNWIREPSGQAVLDAATFFDGRPVHGALDVHDVGRAIQGARDQDVFLALMANEALRFRPPIGAFGHLRGADRIDLKRDGLAPIVGLARVLAMAGGIRVHSTHARLAAAAEHGLISEEGAATLQEAHRFLLGLRLRFQLEAVRRGREPVATLSDTDLRAGETRHLKEAFRAIRDAQEALALKYRTDRF